MLHALYFLNAIPTDDDKNHACTQTENCCEDGRIDCRSDISALRLSFLWVPRPARPLPACVRGACQPRPLCACWPAWWCPAWCPCSGPRPLCGTVGHTFLHRPGSQPGDPAHLAERPAAQWSGLAWRRCLVLCPTVWLRVHCEGPLLPLTASRRPTDCPARVLAGPHAASGCVCRAARSPPAVNSLPVRASAPARRPASTPEIGPLAVVARRARPLPA